MLVIRRRAGESVLIGHDVEVVVLESGSRGVKLGIKAPPEVRILRKEILLAEEQNRAAVLELAGRRLEDVLRELCRQSQVENSLKIPASSPISEV